MKRMVIFASALTCVSGIMAQNVADTLRSQQLNEVIVAGVRATKNAPYAVANINKSELQTFSKQGRELPFLFARTPGIIAWGENGLGTGTAAMRVRGTGASRINVTLDGVSLNSPEDQAVFWANMNSYAALLGSIQIQRGIGTSTNGDGAFGGSISLATASPQLTPSVEVTASYGSYNTYNVGTNFSTGLIGNHFIFDGAYHETATNGFIHGTQGRSGSYYGGLTWLANDKFRISYKNIGNFEKTGQAWNGVVTGNNGNSLINGTYGTSTGITTYKDLYDHGLGKYNLLYENILTDKDGAFVKDANGNYTTYRYKMRDGSYWDKTTDNFYQNHNILSAAYTPNVHWSHSFALHYTYGYGYYSEFKENTKLKKFGLTFTDAAGKEVKKSDFVRMKGLRQHTYGLVYTTKYKNEPWNVIGGLNLQQFRGSHFGYLTYISNAELDAKFRPNGVDYQYYDSKAFKQDYSAYVKASYSFADYWSAFADLQYRYVDYSSDGINDKFYEKDNGYINQLVNIDSKFHFFNPKVGVSYYRDNHKAYASLALANREPERNNYTDNGGNPAPSAERLLDLEVGYQYQAPNWHAGANFYGMWYHNQLVQTGAHSDIGEPLTTNVKRSYRIGVELEAGWSPLSWLSVEGNAALSSNKVKDFDEGASVNWEKSFRTIHYDNSTLAFSPSAILNGFIDVHYKGFKATWHTNFVSSQYLDNTENATRSLPCYSQTNINLGYTLHPEKRFLGVKEISFGADFNNIFSRRYAPTGWVYSSIVEKSGHPNENRYTQIGFMPMAGFNFMGNITLKF